MKYSILGFNQEKIVNYTKDDLKCDLTDLLLLNYIIYAQSNPRMKHILDDDEQSCVWLCHEHLLEDLPILNISEGTLKNRLTKLRKMELITSKTFSNYSERGTKTYYRITELLYEMISDTTSLKNDVKTEPRHLKMTSNNKSNNITVSKDTVNNKVVSKDTTVDFLKSAEKKPKKSLYEKCLALIDNFTDDAILREMLVKILQINLANAKEAGRPFYTNNFVGRLNKLKELSDDNYTQREIVKQSIDNGWSNFYELKNRGYNSNPERSANAKSVDYTQEELDELARQDEERRQRGERVVF